MGEWWSLSLPVPSRPAPDVNKRNRDVVTIVAQQQELSGCMEHLQVACSRFRTKAAAAPDENAALISQCNGVRAATHCLHYPADKEGVACVSA